MADGKIEIQLDIQDDGAQAKGKKAGDDLAKGVESGLKNVGKQAQTAGKEAESALKNTASSAKSSFSDVGDAAKNGFSNVGDAAKTAADDASSAFKNVPSDASGAFSDVSDQAKSGFDGVSDAANNAADSTSDAFKGVGDEIKGELDGVDDQANGIFGTNIPASTAIAAGAVGAVTAKVIELGKKAIFTGAEFDKSMSQVAATMGVATDEVGDLRDFAQEMGETTAFSASQSADALNYMALAGYDAETSMRVLPTVLNLAAAGSMDLAAASDMVTDAQSALGLSVSDAEVMVDQMAKASSKTNTSVEQLGNAFLTVGGTAKNLKGGTKELAQMLGILADNGVKGSEGGTALRNVILSLSAPTDKAATAIKSLGLQVFDAQGNMRSMPDIMNDMNKAMDGMTQEDRTNVLNNIFNKVDLKSVNALLGTSADRFDEVASAIDNSAGAAEQMANTQLDNLAGDVTLLESATEGFMIAVSDKLSPALRDLTQFGTNSLMPFLTEGVKNFDKWAPAVGLVAAAIVLLGGKSAVFKALANEQGMAAKAAKNLGLNFTEMSTRQKVAAVTTNTLRGALSALKTAAPILAITALAEAGMFLYQSWKDAEERTQKFTGATQGLYSAANGATVKIDEETGAVENLSNAYKNIDIDGMVQQHTDLAQSLSDSAQEAAVSQSMLSDYGETINKFADKTKLSDEQLAQLKIAVDGVNDSMGTSYEVVGGNGEAYKIMADGVRVTKDEILDLIEAQKRQIQAEADLAGYKEVYAQLSQDNENLAQAKKNAADADAELQAAEEALQTADPSADVQQLQADYDVAAEKAKRYANELSEVEALQGASQSAMNKYTEKLTLNEMAAEKGASALIKAAAANLDYRSAVQGSDVDLVEFTKALEDMGFKSQDVANLTQDGAMAMAAAYGQGYDEMIAATEKAGLTIPSKLESMSGEAYSKAYSAGAKGGQGFTSGLSDESQKAVSAVLSTVNMSTAEFDKAAKEYGIKGDDAAIAFAEAIASKDGDAKQAAELVANASTEELDGMHNQFYQSGVYAVEGLIDGVNFKAAAAKKAFANLANDSVNALKKAGGEGSPWKKTEKSGVYAALGLIKGIKKKKANAKKSASELASIIVQAADKKLDQLKTVNNVTIKQEIAFWKTIRKKTKKGSDGWYEATKKLTEAKKKQKEAVKKAYDAIITSANNYVNRQKRLYGMSYQQEASYWQKTLKKLKKGTTQYKTAYDNYLYAKKQAAEEVKQKNEDLLDAEQDYVDKLRSIQQQLADDIQAAKDAYLDAIADRKQSILSDLNTFEKYRKKMTISGEKLIENIQSQVDAVRDYESAMKKLEGRIGKGALLDEIKEMGTEGLRYAESLNEMTDEQLKEFVRLYTEKNAVAQREATRQNQDFLKETNDTINNLNKQAKADIEAATKELKSKAAELNTSLSNSVAKMASNVKVSSDSIVASINNAINSLKKLDGRVSTTSSSTRSYALEPSPDTQIPLPQVYNGRQVIFGNDGAIEGYSLMAGDLYGTTRQTELSLMRGLGAMTVAFKQNAAAQSVTVQQEVNFNQPIETPDDVARTMRMQQFYGLAGRYSR